MQMMSKLSGLLANKIPRLMMILCLGIYYLFLHQKYFPRINAFGCFDDCFNFLGGFFLLKGRRLYSEIFFNHQPLAAFISLFIQIYSKPINIYDLILRHRQFLFAYSFIFNSFLIMRFGLSGFLFSIIFESSKFYLFGDRFLAESLTVYPLVYLSGLVWDKFKNKRIYFLDYLLIAFSSWLVIYLRETYILLVIFCYLLLIYGKKTKAKIISLILFLLLNLGFLSIFSLKEYIFNLVNVNLVTNRLAEINIFKSFIYPLLLFERGDWNLFHKFIIGIDILFIFLVILYACYRKRILNSVVIIFILGLANFRIVKPGRIFYEAFHLLGWYAIFLFFTLCLTTYFLKFKKIVGFIFLMGIICLFILLIRSPDNWIYEKIDPHYEFMTNFGPQMQIGEVVRILSKPEDTLFLDGFDDLIYWQADRISLYKYSWYTSVMPKIPLYAQARLEMFKNNPPDFYYGTCPEKEVPEWTMPNEIRSDYQQLYSEGKPTCLYVKKKIISQINPVSWEKAKEFLYELPPKNELLKR